MGVTGHGHTLDKEQLEPAKSAEPKKTKAEAKRIFGQKEEAPAVPEDKCKQMILSAAFDLIMALVIVLNLLLLTVQIQYQGHDAAYRHGISNRDVNWGSLSGGFEMAEKLFNVVYCVEMILRLWALGREFFRHGANLVDALIVIITSLESFVLTPLNEDALVNASALRIVRVFRILRIQKVMQFTEHMHEMRVLIDTLLLSMRGLVWSMLLVAGIIVAAASLMAQLTLAALDDTSVTPERRKWMYNNFGTTARACYTVFEMTFTGRWGNYTRVVLEEVNMGFALVLVPYVVLVNFAVVRVVSALFLKQTLAVAAQDEAKKLEQKQKERIHIAKEIGEFFEEADASGDGEVSLKEFEDMLRHPHIAEHFADLGLQADEAQALFGVLAAEDGQADFHEFVGAAMKMRNNAQVIDIWMCLHRQIMSQQKLTALHDMVNSVDAKLLTRSALRGRPED